MTLGSNKKNFFDGITKNESKKRKSTEEMNGFMRDDDTLRHSFAHNLEDRFESNNYETPSKRPRIEPNLSSNLNTNSKKTGFVMKTFNGFMDKAWNRFKGGKNSNDVNRRSDNDPAVDSSDSGIEVMPSASGYQLNPTNSTNETIATNNESLESNTKKKTSNWFKRNSHKSYDRKTEKLKYLQLLRRHTPHLQDGYGVKETRKAEPPPLIDLTSEKSSISYNNSMQTSQQTFKTERIDKSEKLSLIDRIKMKGLHKSVVVPNKPEKRNVFKFLGLGSSQKNTFSVQHSTPKSILTQSEPKTPEPIEKTVPIPTLPESSKKFNNLVDNKKDYFSAGFVSDLRSSLLKSSQSVDRKITNSETLLNEYHIKRETDCQSLTFQLKTPITRTELLSFTPFLSYDDKFEETDEEEEDEDEDESSPSDFPDLTPDMNKAIDAALRPTPPNEVLSQGFSGLEICRKDMETLKGLNWLNDEIINFYLSLIVERGKNDNFSSVYAFNTFFYKNVRERGPKSVMRWTRKIDVFVNDFVFIPIHLGMHWCLAVIDFIHKRIEYYDSMGGNNMECVHALKDWLLAEHLDKKKSEMPITDWTLEMVKGIPQQMNGSDCGMFSCKYAEYISRRAKINFSQAHMPYFRRRMVYEIITKQLL